MKILIVILAILVTSSALPTDFANEVMRNATFASERVVGFASVGEGTRGGLGGAVWTVWDPWAFRDAITGNAPRMVYVRGHIDLTFLFTSSPGVMLYVGSWKTIIGGDRNAEISGGGLRIWRNQQVIIQNIKFNNALSFAPGEVPDGIGGIIGQVPGEFTEIDAIDCVEATHVWIDHNEFSDDPWNAHSVPEDRMRHDGLIDIKRASNWVTVSNNIFRNHNKVILLGHNDNNAAQDDGLLKTTFVYNWFRGTTQRHPRVRFGEVHVLNNLYTDISDYAIGVGAGASIFVEGNAFINIQAAWRFPVGPPSPMGNLLPVNNHFINSAFPSGIPNDVRWIPSQYYWYNPLVSMNVEAHVRRYAGIW